MPAARTTRRTAATFSSALPQPAGRCLRAQAWRKRAPSLSFEARVSTGFFRQTARSIDATNGLAVVGGIRRHVDEMCVAFVSRRDRLGQQAKAADEMEGRLSSFHSMLASSIQKLGSRRRPQCVIRSRSRSCSPKSNELIVPSSLTWRTSSSCRKFGRSERRQTGSPDSESPSTSPRRLAHG